MSDELIRKSELLEKLNDLYELNWTNDDYVTGFNLGLGVAIEAVEELQPVNAVELPCKVGDKIFEVYRCKIYEQTVKGFTTSDRGGITSCCCGRYKQTGGYVFRYKHSHYKKTKQLIGNIHDNPELLKGE